MLRQDDAAVASAEKRAKPDLKHEYRPIGIGAVAGALVAARQNGESPAGQAANSNERIGSDDWRAA